MKKGSRFLAVIIVGISFWLAGHAHRALAEFSIALGDAEEASRSASATFNEAISDFHLMLAALDRKDLDTAEQFRKQAVEKASSAAGAYEGAAGKASGRELKPIVQNEDERQEVTRFTTLAKANGIQLPITQSSLLSSSARLVNQFKGSLEKARLAPLSRNDQRQQELLNQALELQSLLSAATTMLRIG